MSLSFYMSHPVYSKTKFGRLPLTAFKFPKSMFHRTKPSRLFHKTESKTQKGTCLSNLCLNFRDRQLALLGDRISWTAIHFTANNGHCHCKTEQAMRSPQSNASWEETRPVVLPTSTASLLHPAWVPECQGSNSSRRKRYQAACVYLRYTSTLQGCFAYTDEYFL